MLLFRLVLFLAALARFSFAATIVVNMGFHFISRDGFDLAFWADDWSEHANVIMVSELGYVNILATSIRAGAKSDGTFILNVRFELIQAEMGGRRRITLVRASESGFIDDTFDNKVKLANCVELNTFASTAIPAHIGTAVRACQLLATGALASLEWEVRASDTFYLFES